MKDLFILGPVLFILLVAVIFYLRLYDYVPFVGSVHYFCSRSGVEYMIVRDAQNPILHIGKNGLPVSCQE
jgi:hypothetical protein